MKEYRPKVSILIPLYNSEKYISDTIQSCLNQTYKHIEIIIVDDGSIDNSYKIAKTFEQGNVKIVKQKNKGASAARNKAFEISSGEFIQYLDADDLLSSEKIETQIKIFQKHGNSIVTSCSWGDFYGNLDETKFKPSVLWKDLNPIDWLVSAWESGEMMQPACYLTHKSIIEKAGKWDETLTLNDDGEFFCRVLLQSKKIIFTKGKVYYRRNVENNLSSQKSHKDAASQLNSCISYQKNILLYENSHRIKHALLINYTKFIYIFYNYSDLVTIAKKKILEVGYKKLPVFGGNNFKRVAKIIGFENALRLRKLLKKT